MNRRGHKGRTDGNHTAVMEALREAAISAVSLASVGGGCPDILAGFRGCNVLLELKDGAKPESQRPMTAAEQKFHAEWSGQVCVVDSTEGAVVAVIEAAKALGLV